MRIAAARPSAASPSWAAATTSRAAAATSDRISASAPGSPGSTQRTPEPSRSAATAASPSPSRTASARVAMPEDASKRWTRSRANTDRGQRRRAPIDGAADQVAERRAHLDAGELVGVTHEHHPGVGPERVEEPPQQGQVDHGALVDDDQVVRQGVRSIVAEPAVGQPAEQSVQRRRLRWVVERAGHRVGEARGGLAGRRRDGDAGLGVPRRRLLARPPAAAARPSRSCRSRVRRGGR